MTLVPRTSLTHPLRIDVMRLNNAPGLVGLTFCPGKHGDSIFGSPWARSLERDLDVIAAWNPAAVITLVEHHELQRLQVPTLGEEFRRRGLSWRHLPIRDLDVPDERFEHEWVQWGPNLVELLLAGSRVLVHCRGGLGRAGTVAALLAIEFGDAPARALARVRESRPGAVETAPQEAYVLGYVARFLGDARSVTPSVSG